MSSRAALLLNFAALLASSGVAFAMARDVAGFAMLIIGLMPLLGLMSCAAITRPHWLEGVEGVREPSAGALCLMAVLCEAMAAFLIAVETSTPTLIGVRLLLLMTQFAGVGRFSKIVNPPHENHQLPCRGSSARHPRKPQA